MSPLARMSGVPEVSASGDGDGVQEADAGLMLPVVLRFAPGEGIHAGLVISQVGNIPVLLRATGKGGRGGTPLESSPR